MAKFKYKGELPKVVSLYSGKGKKREVKDVTLCPNDVSELPETDPTVKKLVALKLLEAVKETKSKN